MNPIVGFVICVVLSLFLASPRGAVWWLMLQAIALALNVSFEHAELHAVVAFAEIILLRGVLAPWLFWRAACQLQEPEDCLLPTNLFVWLLGILVVVLAFDFATSAGHAASDPTLRAVAITVALALLLLATNTARSAQLYALMILENGVLCFESLFPQPWSAWVHAALASVYVLTIWVGTSLAVHVQEELPDELGGPTS